MGLLVASLINFLLVRLFSLGGRPPLGRFAVVPYSFHFLMMDFMVLREMFKALDISLILSKTHIQTFLNVFKALF